MKDWRRRYFVLKGSKLFFAKVRAARARRAGARARARRPDETVAKVGLPSDRAQSENATPHGMIDLASCMTVKSAEYKAHKRNALEVSTQDTTYLMCADTEKEKDDWIGAIGRAIVRCSATFTNDDGMDGASDDD